MRPICRTENELIVTDGLLRLYHGSSVALLGSIALGDDAENLRVVPHTNRITVGWGSGALANIVASSPALMNTVYDWRHYLAVVQRKPGRNGAPFAELPPAFRALQQRMLKTPGGHREMVEILALVLQHDEQAVLVAVELALEAGAPTKTHILNLLHRLVGAGDKARAGRPGLLDGDGRPVCTEMWPGNTADTGSLVRWSIGCAKIPFEGFSPRRRLDRKMRPRKVPGRVVTMRRSCSWPCRARTTIRTSCSR